MMVSFCTTTPNNGLGATIFRKWKGVLKMTWKGWASKYSSLVWVSKEAGGF